jgi:hypothetical protein
MGPIRTTWPDGKYQRVRTVHQGPPVGLRVVAAAIKKDTKETEECNQRGKEERKQNEERDGGQKRINERPTASPVSCGIREEAKGVRLFAQESAECADQLELAHQDRA